MAKGAGYAVGQLSQHIDALEEASNLIVKLAIMGTTLGFSIVITSTWPVSSASDRVSWDAVINK